MKGTTAGNGGFLSRLWTAVKGYLYIPVTILLFAFLFGVVLIYGIVPSGSMEPLCKTGSIYVGNRLAYMGAGVERGDVVLVSHNNTVYCKRVIGLPGEEVSIADGAVWIDSVELDESAYLPESVETTAPLDTYVVPDGCYFILGDNRSNSMDARYWDDAYVSGENILGKYLWSVHIPFLSKGAS